ncbi:hypothetical protein [Kingella oralis]
MYRCAVYRRLLSTPESADLIAILTFMNIHIRPYSPEYCQAVLNLSLRAWQPVFAQLFPIPCFLFTANRPFHHARNSPRALSLAQSRPYRHRR